MHGADSYCSKSIANDFPEEFLPALMYDLNGLPSRMCYPWPGDESDQSPSRELAAEKAAILLLAGFVPRPGVPHFVESVKTSQQVAQFN